VFGSEKGPERILRQTILLKKAEVSLSGNSAVPFQSPATQTRSVMAGRLGEVPDPFPSEELSTFRCAFLHELSFRHGLAVHDHGAFTRVVCV
jgi:hypothetical protein